MRLVSLLQQGHLDFLFFSDLTLKITEQVH
jgi:hypothetical protein